MWIVSAALLQVRAILYIATLTTGIMEAVTNLDHAVAAALSTRHHHHNQGVLDASTHSSRKLRVQNAILMPVREALKNLHESDDCAWKGETGGSLKQHNRSVNIKQSSVDQLVSGLDLACLSLRQLVKYVR